MTLHILHLTSGGARWFTNFTEQELTNNLQPIVGGAKFGVGHGPPGPYCSVPTQYGVNVMGVGARCSLLSQLWGWAKTFLAENYVWQIDKVPEFYEIIARKILKMPNFLYDICLKNISPIFWWGARTPTSPKCRRSITRSVLGSSKPFSVGNILGSHNDTMTFTASLQVSRYITICKTMTVVCHDVIFWFTIFCSLLGLMNFCWSSLQKRVYTPFSACE